MGIQFVDKYANGAKLDGADPEAAYQMVPLGGRRSVAVKTDAAPCMLSVTDTAKCVMSDFTDTKTKAVFRAGSAHALRLPANTGISFFVEGLSPGFSALKLTEDSRFQISTDMTISVKAPRALTYCFVFLSDIVRRNVRGQIEPRVLMQGVAPLFLEQANVELRELGHMRDVMVMRDLGDPIVASDDSRLAAIVAATSAETMASVDFVIYCCWNIEINARSRDTLALAIGNKYAFLEVTSADFDHRVHAVAHEFGHLMGLHHTRDNTLMFRNDLGRSNRVTSGDIEVLNPPVGGILP